MSVPTMDIPTKNEMKPIIDPIVLQNIFGLPQDHENLNVRFVNERNTEDETVMSNERDFGRIVFPDSVLPSATADPSDDDQSKNPLLDTDGSTVGPDRNHHGDDKGGGAKEGHDGSHPSPDSSNQVNRDHGTNKWWPIDDDGDHPGEPNVLESRFGESLPASPPLTSVDVNAYQQRKNLAHGMMDLALLSANASQLRYVLEASAHPYYCLGVVLVSLSIIMQVAVGILLILNSRYDVTDKAEIRKAITVNNVTVGGVFLVSIANVFISSFSVTPTASH